MATHKWKEIRDKLPAMRRKRVDAAVQHELRTMEDEAYPQMLDFLEKYGLQITLKTLIDALQYKIKTGKPYLVGSFVLEALKGIYSGYRERFKFE